MSYHYSNGDAGGASGGGIEYSGDVREAPGGGEERPDSDIHDKPKYLLEHLATFTVSKESGIVYPADGMRRLLQLEKTTGIWSQKMQLCLDYQWILIMDYETGNIIERFPATLIQEPTAFTSTDAMELYNNILVFIVSGGGGSRSEMHIFQSQSVSAVHLVEDLKNLRSGKIVTQQRQSSLQEQHQQQKLASESGIGKSVIAALTTQIQTTDQRQYHQHHAAAAMTALQQRSIDQFGMRSAGGTVEINHAMGGCETDSEHGGINDETSSTSSDKYERDVTVLNHCFDDIEKFIARLQHAAAASRELERRRRSRKTKKKDPGEGLLTLRTRPPHEKEFIDIFAKFKLSFNLLAKLKAHIHDPNAPELVHFLFTPLALIVEASSDTYYESQLPGRVINPLLTREAINLLINCVTSKETELWRSLGDAWIIPRDQWKHDVGSYHPVFLDGWSPDYLVIDELETPTTPTNMNKRNMEIAQSYHYQSGGHNMDGGGLNGRGIAGDTALMIGSGGGGGSGRFYDDYDSSAIALNEKYIIHYGQTEEGRDRGESAPTGGGGIGGNIASADFSTRSEISIDSIERHNVSGNGGAAGQNSNVLQAITAGMQSLGARNIVRCSGAVVGVGACGIGESGSKGVIGGGTVNAGITQLGLDGDGPNSNDNHVLETWLDEVQSSGVKIVLVTYPRTANNDKELSVVRGEYLEILDDTRKWWKARNIRGQIGHVPHTIVTAYNYGDAESSNQFYGPHNNHKSRLVAAANVDQNEQRSNDTTDWVRNKQLGKKGEFRYF